MNIRQIFGLLAAIACAGSVQAQRVGWEADFKTRFDNREFTGSSCNESQTIFLADLSTAVSYNWLDRNTLRFGVGRGRFVGILLPDSLKSVTLPAKNRRRGRKAPDGSCQNINQNRRTNVC